MARAADEAEAAEAEAAAKAERRAKRRAERRAAEEAEAAAKKAAAEELSKRTPPSHLKPAADRCTCAAVRLRPADDASPPLPCPDPCCANYEYLKELEVPPAMVGTDQVASRRWSEPIKLYSGGILCHHCDPDYPDTPPLVAILVGVRRHRDDASRVEVLPRFFVRASDPLVEMHWGDGPPPPRALVYRIDGPEGKGAASAWVQEWSRSDCVVSACTVKRVAADDVERECAAAADGIFVYGAAVRMPGDKKPRNLPPPEKEAAPAPAPAKRAAPAPASSDSEDEQPLRRKPATAPQYRGMRGSPSAKPLTSAASGSGNKASLKPGAKRRPDQEVIELDDDDDDDDVAAAARLAADGGGRGGGGFKIRKTAPSKGRRPGSPTRLRRATATAPRRSARCRRGSAASTRGTCPSCASVGRSSTRRGSATGSTSTSPSRRRT